MPNEVLHVEVMRKERGGKKGHGIVAKHINPHKLKNKCGVTF